MSAVRIEPAGTVTVQPAQGSPVTVQPLAAAAADVSAIYSGPPGPRGLSDQAAIEAHAASEAPHPIYDGMPTLSLIFENQLV